LAANRKHEDEAQRIFEALRAGTISADDAFDRLYRSHYASVRWLFRQWVPCFEDREELTQETFLRIYQSIGTFRGDCSFSTFVYKVSKNVFLGYRRNKLADKRSGLEIRLGDGPETDPGSGRDQPIPPAPARQEEEALLGELGRRVREVVLQMPEQRRKCLILKYYYDLTVREIASLLQLAEGTVKAHLHQAREQLRSLLDADLLEEGA
jgi:RNA polymerase sigma-70 factor (ECF subfamily)